MHIAYILPFGYPLFPQAAIQIFFFYVTPVDAYRDVGGRATQDAKAETGVQSKSSLPNIIVRHPFLCFSISPQLT
jgi:hypothetical protein